MPGRVELNGVRFEKDCISNIQDGRVFARMERDEVQSLTIVCGVLSHRPVLQVIVGALVALFALCATCWAIIELIQGDHPSRHMFASAAVVPFGAWVIYDALKVGYYLRLEGRTKTLKFTFSRKTDLDRIRDLARQAHAELGYDVLVSE